MWACQIQQFRPYIKKSMTYSMSSDLAGGVIVVIRVDKKRDNLICAVALTQKDLIKVKDKIAYQVSAF